ncbi:MAG: glutamyl-tRNA amidotransferase [Microbacteriaceae bacterium]|nr:glutamyl-tRNA amidotransferase [Microbacteriaceae bacterium]
MIDSLSENEALNPATSDESVCFMSVEKLAEALARGEFTSRELVETHLRRIDRINPALNAYVTVLHDDALDEADASDRRRRGGTTLGPLDGVPVSVKDVEAMAGVRFTMGLQPLSDNVSTTDPPHIRSFRGAGAVILGKTNTPEMGHKGVTDNLLFGPTLNPHRLTHNAGGSSGGAASSVASGLAVLAQGSDGGGSLRIPAAMSGVVGMKASAFAVPEERRPDAFQASVPFQSIGALARDVSDARFVTTLLAGEPNRDPAWAPMPSRSGRRVDEMTIGFDATFGNFPVSGEVLAATGTAMSELSSRFAIFELQTDLPDHEELAVLWLRLISVQTAFNAQSLAESGTDLLRDHRDQIPDELAALIETGFSLSAIEHRRDSVARSVVFDLIEDALDRVDVIATPTLTVAGVPNGPWGRTVGPSTIEGRAVEPTIGWALTYPLNFTGHPAISIPLPTRINGLPLGLQLIGRRWSDLDLLDLAGAIEEAFAA